MKITIVFILFFLFILSSKSQYLEWERMSYLPDTNKALIGMEIKRVTKDEFAISFSGLQYRRPGYYFVGLYYMLSNGQFKWRQVIEKDKPLVYQLLNFTNDNNIELLASYSDVWVDFEHGRFFLNKIQFDTSGKILYDYFDTTKQSTFLSYPGPVIVTENGYSNFNFKGKENDNTLYLMEKRFDFNANLIAEVYHNFFPDELIDTLKLYNGHIKLINIINVNDDGYLMTFKVFLPPPNFMTYSVLLKVNNDFKTSWYNSYRKTEGSTSINNVISLNGNGYLISGKTDSEHPDSTIFLNRIDDNGNLIKFLTFPTKSKEDKITSLLVLGDNILAMGSFKEDTNYILKLFFLDTDFTTTKSIDVVKRKNKRTIMDMVYFDNCLYSVGSINNKLYVNKICALPVSVNISNQLFQNKNYYITPNPAIDYIEIKNVMLNEAKEPVHSVKIYDVLGVCVLTHPLAPSREGESVRLDVLGLAAGVYFIRVGDKMYKFVKM